MGAHELPASRRALIALVLGAAVLARAEEAPPAPAAACDATLPEGAAAMSMVAEDEAPPPGSDVLPPVPEASEIPSIGTEEKSNISFVPIPEIILDPNEGNTYGLLGVWLFLDDKDEIKYMFAPDVRYNETKGVFPNLRLFGYPSRTERYSILVGKSTTRDENYDVEYANRGLWDERAYFLTRVLYERDSTERFYGFGNNTPQGGESNYTSNDFRADATPGVWVVPHFSVSYRMRIRRFDTEHGQVSGVPYIGTKYPGLKNKGIDPTVYWQHRLSLTYDSRDSMDMPTEGAYANGYVEGADQHVGSSTSFCAFGFEWRDFIPFRGARRNPILAMRALVDYLDGPSDTPYFLRNTLGGRRYLRGYGSDRFTAFNRSLFGAELRTRVYERKLFGVNAEVELAPFVEAGQVFKDITDPPLNDLHWVGGLGFRGLVRPQIVAFVDVGYGGEGASVFTGIDYPF